MYTFVDKGGRSLTLRPEYTPSVVRAILDNRLYLQPFPMRYYFIGPMFRYDKPQKGRYRQFHQADIEVFGELDPAVDAEIVEMAMFLLTRLGVKGIEVFVNSVGCRKCRPSYLQELKLKAREVKESLCVDCQRKTETNPLRIFDCKIEACREATQDFPQITDHLCPECKKHFEQFCSHLDLFGISFQVEPRLVRGIDYYTKTTFEIVSSELGAQDAILGGGRYDEMIAGLLGSDREYPAVGISFGIEPITAMLKIGKKEIKKTVTQIYIIPIKTAKKCMSIA